jgi:hypothetical protein
MKLEDALNLLEVDSLPGDEEDESFLLGILQETVERKGVEWIKRHRGLVYDQLDDISQM